MNWLDSRLTPARQPGFRIHGGLRRAVHVGGAVEGLMWRVLRHMGLALVAGGGGLAEVGCGGDDIQSPTAGNLEITTVTGGVEPDPDGYAFAVDGGTSRPIGVSGTATLANVAAGTHSVDLSGLAANCRVEGTNPRSVTVAGGATAKVSFAITCTATTGSIQITTTTTGSSLDDDGYTVSVDGSASQPIGINATLRIPSITPGDHTVTLAGVASNCTVGGANPWTVAIAAGVEASVDFTVTCTAAGVTRWTTFPLPSGFVATALWANSRSDLFVAGSYQSAPTAYPNVVLHYNGHDWTEQLREPVYGLWGSSPTDVFAVGGNMVWHYDGVRWQPFYDGHETEDGYDLDYRAIWGSSAQDLFVVGWINRTPAPGWIDHYDGQSWSQQNHGIGAYGEIHDVAGSSPTDVYALGTETSTAEFPPELEYVDHRVLHYDGTTWSVSYRILVQPAGNGDFNDQFLTGVWATARNDVFVVGFAGRIFHFDGAAWSPMTSPTSQHLEDVWGNSGSNVYAVGIGGILRYDGRSWTVINPSPGSRVWGTETDVFVISNGAILHGTP